MLAGALAGCTGAGEGESAGSGDTWDEGCSGVGGTGGPMAVFSEAWIGPVIEDGEPLWRAPRVTCEASRITAMEYAGDGSLYVSGYGAVVKDACLDACPARHWLRRLDAGYSEVWVRTIDFADGHWKALGAAPGGGVVVGGAAIDGAVLRPWVVHRDAAGEVVWEVIFDEVGMVNDLAIGTDGSIVAVGGVEAGGTTDLWVVKLSSAGSLAWSATYGAERYESAAAVDLDDSGRVWVAGGRGDTSPDSPLKWDYMPAPGDLDFAPRFDAAVVALFDAAGGLVGAYVQPEVTPASPYPGARAIGVLPGGEAIVGGGRGSDEDWLARLGEGLIPIWERQIGEWWGITALEVAGDGTVAVVSGTEVFWVDGEGAIAATASDRDFGDVMARAPGGELVISGVSFRGVWFGDPGY